MKRQRFLDKLGMTDADFWLLCSDFCILTSRFWLRKEADGRAAPGGGSVGSKGMGAFSGRGGGWVHGVTLKIADSAGRG